MSEKAIQNEIRNALAGRAHIFRANVGKAWTGDARKLPNGDVLISNARPFSTGLDKGFSDLFGFTSRIVTQEDVGTKLAIFTAVEVKAPKGNATDEQLAFIAAVQAAGGLAGIARSVADAEQILFPKRPCLGTP